MEAILYVVLLNIWILLVAMCAIPTEACARLLYTPWNPSTFQVVSVHDNVEGLPTMTHESQCNQVWYHQELNVTHIETTYPNSTTLIWRRAPPSVCLPNLFLRQLARQLDSFTGPFSEPTYPEVEGKRKTADRSKRLMSTYHSYEDIPNNERNEEGVVVAVQPAVALRSNSSEKYYSGLFLRELLDASLSRNDSFTHVFGRFEGNEACRITRFVASKRCPRSFAQKIIPEHRDNGCRRLPRGATIESYCSKYGYIPPKLFSVHAHEADNVQDVAKIMDISRLHNTDKVVTRN